MRDLNYTRDRVLRDNRTAWSVVVALVVSIIVVVGVYAYSSYDGDKSSAVRNESPPQSPLTR
jgi:hypothetical protein